MPREGSRISGAEYFLTKFAVYHSSPQSSSSPHPSCVVAAGACTAATFVTGCFATGVGFARGGARVTAGRGCCCCCCGGGGCCDCSCSAQPSSFPHSSSSFTASWACNWQQFKGQNQEALKCHPIIEIRGHKTCCLDPRWMIANSSGVNPLIEPSSPGAWCCGEYSGSVSAPATCCAPAENHDDMVLQPELNNQINHSSSGAQACHLAALCH